MIQKIIDLYSFKRMKSKNYQRSIYSKNEIEEAIILKSLLVFEYKVIE